MADSKVVKTGRQIMLNRMYTVVPTQLTPTQFSIGQGTTDPVDADTRLEQAVPISGTESVDDAEVTTGWADDADITLSVNAVTFKEGSGSLNLTKDGTAGTTAGTEKTVTSLDFTSKTLSIWLLISDSATLNKLVAIDAITIRYGSDSSNFFTYTIDRSEFTAGAFVVFQTFTSSNADSTTGTPILTAMDYFRIDVNTTLAADTWSAGDVIFDDIKLISSDDFFKDVEPGFPALDIGLVQATFEADVNTLEGNGYLITETGLFNKDSPVIMESRDTFTFISKTTDDELIFTFKNRIVAQASGD